MIKNNWRFLRSVGVEYAIELFKLLRPEYERIFGTSVMNNEVCCIYNDPHSPSPSLQYGNPLRIRTNVSSLDYWCQEIYQLSHELCHYAIRQKKKQKDFVLSWFEEILCEAMSLYALHYAASHWKQCELYVMNPTYDEGIADYLAGVYRDPASRGLRECDTLEKLLRYENSKMSETHRESHVIERNLVYNAILLNPTEARCFLDYDKYISSENRLLIDFKKWYKDCPCDMVKTLSSIQPIK